MSGHDLRHIGITKVRVRCGSALRARLPGLDAEIDADFVHRGHRRDRDDQRRIASWYRATNNKRYAHENNDKSDQERYERGSKADMEWTVVVLTEALVHIVHLRCLASNSCQSDRLGDQFAVTRCGLKTIVPGARATTAVHSA